MNTGCETWGSIKGGELLNWPSDYWLLKNDSIPRSWVVSMFQFYDLLTEFIENRLELFKIISGSHTHIFFHRPFRLYLSFPFLSRAEYRLKLVMTRGMAASWKGLQCYINTNRCKSFVSEDSVMSMFSKWRQHSQRIGSYLCDLSTTNKLFVGFRFKPPLPSRSPLLSLLVTWLSESSTLS